jgi:hypothetical protein
MTPPVNRQLDDATLGRRKSQPHEVLLGPTGELGRKPADDRRDDWRLSPAALDIVNRLLSTFDPAATCPLERGLQRKGEPLSPQDRRERAHGACRFSLVAEVEREGDEAQAGVADPNLVDVEIESGG